MIRSRLAFWICFITSLALMVIGFIIPPTGVIDSSVLIATGILFAFGTLYELPTIIKNGRVSVKKGDFEVEVDPEE